MNQIQKQIQELETVLALQKQVIENAKILKSVSALNDVAVEQRKARRAKTVAKPAPVAESKPQPKTEAQSSVRKNTSFGKKTWYSEEWKEGDRSAKQFGFLLSLDRNWIESQESNHVRISKQLASQKISELVEARKSSQA